MASTVEAAGTKTSDTMGQKLADAIGAMESRQHLMNERMTEFVEQIRNLVRESQSETNQKLQTTLSEIGEAVRLQIASLKEQGESASASHSEREGQIASQTQDMLRQIGTQVDTVVGALQTQFSQAATAQIEREQRMATQADKTVARLGALTEGLMAEMRTITSEVRNTADAMRTITTDAVSRMNSGAETLFLAADEFTKAGQGVAGVLQQATGVSGKLADAAASVSTSSAMLQGVVADYATTRETLSAMLADLRGTVENAKREASLTSDVLARIESASQGLGQAHKDVEEYLLGVSNVLTEAHSGFRENVDKVLRESYDDFYTRLSGATSLLRQAIQELELALVVEPTSRRV
jgi:predicted  nucleic acid-binding Zn-ribbon protein